MAIPIKQTPVLKGRSGERFEQEVRKNESHPVPRSEYDRAHAVYSALKKKSDVWR
jgi:hypothetical protein